jgi:signal transduction histidine kinase
MYLRALFTCILICFSVAITAQGNNHFHIRQYGTEDGLPSNGIKGLQWDTATRFLWIATEAGIVRYNGMSFKSYTGEDNPHITNERILFLIRNNAGRIYTADNMGNIFYVDKNTLAFYKKQVIAGNSASNIITLSVSDKFFQQDHKIKNGPYALQFDQIIPETDTSCLILRNNTLYYFSISMLQTEPLALPDPGVRWGFKSGKELFLTDRKNNFWHFNTSSRTFTRINLQQKDVPSSTDPGNSILLWDNGMAFPLLLNKEKIWKIKYENGILYSQLISNQVPQDVLVRYAQYDEKLNTLFLGTDSKGIIIMRQNLVEPVRKVRATTNERTSYYSQLELPDGNIITNEGHILGKNSPMPNLLLTGQFSTSTYLQADSLFWFIRRNEQLGYACLHKYNLLSNHLTPYPKIRPDYAQLVMTESGGQLYMANESGIFRMNNDSLETIYPYPSLEKLRTHFDMKEISPGILAIANCYALLKFDTRTKKLDTLYSDGNYCVRTIWTYKDYIFFGTYGNGLYISHNGVVKALPLDKNRHLLFTHCFVDDGNGYCWISTNRGLFKASIEDMINAYEKNDPQVYYHYFGRNDGMEMTEMNGGCTPCGLLMKNKTISFPTMEGMLWVNPLTATPVLPDGEIFIDEVTVDNKRIEPYSFDKENINAFHRDVLIRLGFSAWCNKENIYLQYRLNNEREWKEVNTDNGALIQLGNLESGTYTLYIRKMNGFGVNNYSYKQFTFSVPAPWYQRWWFYILSTALVFGVLSLYFRYRTRQYELREQKLEDQVTEKTKELQEKNEVLEKNNSIKTRLISIISHDIVTPLKFLNVAGKNLIEKRKLMTEDLQVETLKEITNTSQELQLLSTNILNWIKYQNENRRLVKENFNLHEMVAQLLGLLQSLARQKKLIILNDVETSLEIHQYYEPLKILIYNLLTNAIHFTEKGAIVVSAVKENGHITVSVKDEGIGMSPEQIQRLMADEVVITSANVDNKKGHGLGYLIIKDLLKTMDASLDIQSKKGEGATVSIQMKN